MATVLQIADFEHARPLLSRLKHRARAYMASLPKGEVLPPIKPCPWGKGPPNGNSAVARAA